MILTVFRHFQNIPFIFSHALSKTILSAVRYMPILKLEYLNMIEPPFFRKSSWFK